MEEFDIKVIGNKAMFPDFYNVLKEMRTLEKKNKEIKISCSFGKKILDFMEYPWKRVIMSTITVKVNDIEIGYLDLSEFSHLLYNDLCRLIDKDDKGVLCDLRDTTSELTCEAYLTGYTHSGLKSISNIHLIDYQLHLIITELKKPN